MDTSIWIAIIAAFTVLVIASFATEKWKVVQLKRSEDWLQAQREFAAASRSQARDARKVIEDVRRMASGEAEDD